MSKIKIYQLKQTNSHLKELNAFETTKIVGGYDEETESSQDIIQKAMQEAVMRSDISLNANRANRK
ncbi:hypothetical protein I4641_20975 [Waterburya agarophytonicola K14]|uniref:Uncharacterized protein n=1 Tax=Waterburya agarophytonicola KI4 TaxID=2874699 RepID=A0A964BUJ2_9CYAN|nr:hypothetical protein [Waterburya agarophytonicola]MCC0179439.1 hypothetical protein [Waterburya agarophytonicola KI4]